MHSKYILYRFAFFAGLIVLIVGAYLKFFNQTSSTQFEYRRFGTSVENQTIDGNGTLILGVLVLLFSLWMYKTYKSEKSEREERRKKEEQELLHKKNKGNG